MRNTIIIVDSIFNFSFFTLKWLVVSINFYPTGKSFNGDTPSKFAFDTPDEKSLSLRS